MKRFLIISALAAATFLLFSPALADTIDMATEDPELKAIGEETMAYLGHSVVMGDLNNDGFDDVIVSEPDFDEEFMNGQAGRVLVYWGNDDEDKDLTIRTAGEIPNPDHYQLQYWKLGWDLAVGDINGDGIDDLVLSAPGAENPDDWYSVGMVFVVYGRSTWTVDEIVLDPYPDVRKAPLLADVNIFNDQGMMGPCYGLGQTIAAGDLNNDGFDDIIASCCLSSSQTVFVIYGDDFDKSTILFLEESWDQQFLGLDVPSGGFGRALASGDVSSDGVDDLLIGAPGWVTVYDEGFRKS